MSNEAEPMPPLWTSDMTGQIYPVGGVPENPAIQTNCRTETQLFLIFLKERISCGLLGWKNNSNRGFTFL